MAGRKWAKTAQYADNKTLMGARKTEKSIFLPISLIFLSGALFDVPEKREGSNLGVFAQISCTVLAAALLAQMRSGGPSLSEAATWHLSHTTDGPFAITGIFGERSCGLRYLRTVGSETPVTLEMPAMDSPSLRILRISWTLDMLIIPLRLLWSTTEATTKVGQRSGWHVFPCD